MRRAIIRICAYLVVTGDVANGIIIGYQTLEYSFDPIYLGAYIPRYDHHGVSKMIPILPLTALPNVLLIWFFSLSAWRSERQ